MFGSTSISGNNIYGTTLARSSESNGKTFQPHSSCDEMVSGNCKPRCCFFQPGVMSKTEFDIVVHGCNGDMGLLRLNLVVQYFDLLCVFLDRSLTFVVCPTNG